METIKRGSISEEVRYVWEYPKCGDYNETSDDPCYDVEITCEGCGESFELED